MAYPQGGRYGDFVLGNDKRKVAPQAKFNSYSGTDIQCFFFDNDLWAVQDEIDSSTLLTEEEKIRLSQDNLGRRRADKVETFGDLSTLTISSARSFGPIRRLGELKPVDYKGGSRTIAGSMIFAMLNRDVWSDFMNGLIPGSEGVGTWRGPTFVDEIPAFNILIRGANEYGSVATGLLVGVRLTNFGTTFSVDDLYTEATYSYVATEYYPFTDDWLSTLKHHAGMIPTRRDPPLSIQWLNSKAYEFVKTSDGEYVPWEREVYDFMKSLPQNQHEMMIELGPNIVWGLMQGSPSPSGM
jgi:hypothetical protein